MRLVTKVSVVLVTVVLFSTLFGNASDEPALHEISGFVVDESGVPVDGALIEVFNISIGEFVMAARAGPDGHYRMRIHLGEYIAHVRPPEASGLIRDHRHFVVDGSRVMGFVLEYLPDIGKRADVEPVVEQTRPDNRLTLKNGGMYAVFGRVSDQSGNPIWGADVGIVDPATNTVVTSTTTTS